MPFSRFVTIQDIAAAARVSKSTVSLAMRGSERISAETTERVLAIARELGYVYNRHAAELRRGRPSRIGVVINDLMNPFFAELLVGLERCLVEAGYIFFIANTNECPDRQRTVLTAMCEQGSAGIVMCPALGTEPGIVDTLKLWRVPLVLIMRPLGRDDCDFCGADDVKGVRLAIDRLVQHGHHHIAFLGGQAGNATSHRVQAYREALSAVGLKCDDGLIIPCRPDRQGGHDAMLRLLQHAPQVCAAVCYNDLTAYGALSALEKSGLQPGVQFSLTGFDNVLGSAQMQTPLSTLDLRPAHLGERAGTMLLERIRDPDMPRQLYLCDPWLVHRRTG